MPSRRAPALSRTESSRVPAPPDVSTRDAREIELKLEIDPGTRHLRPADITGARGRTEQLVTTYFDTSDGDVRRTGCSLRIRRKRDARTQTIKAAKGSASGLFTRTEWTRSVTSDRPVLDAIGGPFGPALRAIGTRRLKPRIVTDFHRTHGVINRDGGAIEWAIDEGEISAGGNVAPLREIELELRRGPAKILFDLARAIAEQIPVRIAVVSKSERGYRLLDQATTTAARAEPILLERSGTACAAFATIAHSCLRQFRLNETLLLESGDVEAVHQSRVALRRLRTAFWLHEPLLADDPQAALLDADLRWLTGRLGEVRNLDALIPGGHEEARHQLRVAREHAMTTLRTDLASSRTRGMMLDLAEWLAIGAWQNRPPTIGGPPEDVTSFASDALRKLRKRLKRRGKGLARLGPRRRHRARITVKKLRYASDFFVSLFPSPRAARRHMIFIKALSALQDYLGELNDLDLERRIVKSVADSGGKGHRHRRRKHSRKLLQRAERAYEAVIAAKGFWSEEQSLIA